MITTKMFECYVSRLIFYLALTSRVHHVGPDTLRPRMTNSSNLEKYLLKSSYLYQLILISLNILAILLILRMQVLVFL